MQATKEKAANIAFSAKSGTEKTKAIMGEKVEKMTAHDDAQKEMATQKKEDRMRQAECNKQEIYENNAAARQASYSTGEAHSYSATGERGQHTGSHPMSALPGHGTGEPIGQVIEGVVESHPIGTATGTQRSSAAQNRHVEAATDKGYGTGGSDSG